MYEISNTKNKCIQCGRYLGYLNPDAKVFYPNKKERIKETNSFFSIKAHPKFGILRKRCFDCAYSKFKSFNCRPNIYASEYVGYLFDIDTIHFRKEKSVTLENMQRKYGIEDGERRYNEYRQKQAYSNTFEYKNKKFGMSILEFDNYNKSRAITLENMTRKYGKIKGKEKYDLYCEKQSRNGNKLDYFVEKYGYSKGVEEYKRVCSEKKLTLENFIRKYGGDLGEIKFNEYIQGKKLIGFYSKTSQSLFQEILKQTQIKTKIYFAEHNGEFGIMDRNSSRYYLYDFCIPEYNKIIEFNGDYWHCNPSQYNEDHIHDITKLSAKEIWDNDRIKIDFAESLGYEIFTVWEMDYKTDKNKVIEQCLIFLEDRC